MDSKYVTDFKYVRVLNVRKFWLIWQGSEYASGWNFRRVLNIPGFGVCQVSSYASVGIAQETETSAGKHFGDFSPRYS